jgi:hypothetical protein
VLGKYKDVVRYICEKHLVHWFENQADYHLSIKFGRLLFEEERGLYMSLCNRSNVFVKTVDNETTQNLMYHICASELLCGKNVTLISRNRDQDKENIKALLRRDRLLIMDKVSTFQYQHTGIFWSVDDSISHTVACRVANVIIVADYNRITPVLFTNTVIPALMGKSVFLAFYFEYNDRTLRIGDTLSNKKFCHVIWQ